MIDAPELQPEAERHHARKHLPISLIDESPTNPRRYFDPDKMAQLTADVARRGILQEVVVRPKPPRFELVFGARRLRAATAAGLKEIPATVRRLSDQEVLELQATENRQREDVHPLEEAEAFERLRAGGDDWQGLTADEIAHRLALSRSHVYQRLKLLELTPTNRERFVAGKFSAGVALQIARIAQPKLQERAAEELITRGQGEATNMIEAREWIRQRYTLRLVGAPFALDDANLLEKAGACNACPKRSGNQPELFGDVAGDVLCADPDCFAAKTDALIESLRQPATLARQGVMTRKESRKLFDGTWLRPDAGFVDLDATCPEDLKGRTYRKLVGKHPEGMITTIDADNKLRYLLPKEGLRARLDEFGKVERPKKEAKPPTADERRKAAADDERRTTTKKTIDTKRVRDLAFALSIADVVAHVEKLDAVPARLLGLLVALVLDELHTGQGPCARRNLDAQELRAKAAKMGYGESLGLLVEILADRAGIGPIEYPAELEALFAFADVDAQKHEEEIRASLEGGVEE